jgi:hypothetical protein
VKTIPLTRGQEALVDDGDFTELSKHKWSALKKPHGWYAVRASDNKYLYMHRIIMEAQPGQEIDHHDADGLNNQRSNLRFATSGQNKANMRPFPGGTSRYKGVHRHSQTGRWVAQFGRVDRYIGCFDTEEAAAAAYLAVAQDRYGEFARGGRA